MDNYTVVIIFVALCFCIIIGAGIYQLIDFKNKYNVCESWFNGVSVTNEPTKCYVDGTLYEIEKLSNGQYIKARVVSK